jgi:Ni,Fe-hydrogenase III large subunit
VRLEARLGYVHKGIEGLMQGRTPAAAARLAARISGDSTVAHSLAFARAVEAALNVTVPPRAVWLRAFMAEMERIANHIGDIGAICNDAAFAYMLAECGQLRERVAETARTVFGHRLMMDRVIPGGVAVDITTEGLETVRTLIEELRRRFLPLVQLYDTATSLLDRTIGTGIISSGLVHRFAAGGYIGRASGRGFDSRSSLPYPPYNDLVFDVPKRNEGDVNARVWVRILEVQESLGLLDQITKRLPGTARVADRAPPLPWVTLPEGPGEGMAVVEGFRGEILTWVRLAPDGTIARCHPRDPSWFQWPLLEAAIEGNIVADFPLCNKSVNGSYSGHDL